MTTPCPRDPATPDAAGAAPATPAGTATPAAGTATPEPGAAPARTRFADPVAQPAPAEVPPAESPGAPAAQPVAAPTAGESVPAATSLLKSPPVVNAAELPPTAPEPAPVPVPDPPRGHDVPAPRDGRAVTAVLTAVVVVLAGLAGFLGWRAVDTSGKGPVEKSRTAALAAARTAAPLVFSYDYRHLAADFKAGRAVTTGQFQSEYDKTTAKLVADVAPRYKAVVVADVSAASVVQASRSTVLALVFVNQSSSSSLNAQPKLTTSRLEMTMVARGDRWLVSKIKAL